MSEGRGGVWAYEKYFFMSVLPPYNAHRSSPRYFGWFWTVDMVEKWLFFADRHAKVRQSEHYFSIVFIYYGIILLAVRVAAVLLFLLAFAALLAVLIGG